MKIPFARIINLRTSYIEKHLHRTIGKLKLYLKHWLLDKYATDCYLLVERIRSFFVHLSSHVISPGNLKNPKVFFFVCLFVLFVNQVVTSWILKLTLSF